jgi:hypothetical protein
LAHSRIARTTFALAALSLATCKKDPPASLPDPTPPLATASAAASSTEHDHTHELNLPPAGQAVKVNFEGKSADVVLSSVTGTPLGVPVTKLWSSAFGPVDPAALRFDFVGSDGFRSGAREKCKVLLTGRDLTAATIDVTTHNLSFEEGSKLPGCYRVKAIVSVDVTR